jgi:DNA-binding CsgD family transcriptional regulator
MESWARIRHEDRIALWAFHHPGVTGNFPVAGPIFDGCDAARAHCNRADAGKPFSESEREAMQLVVPHLVAASRRARIAQLRARTHVSEGHGQAAAIANEDGLVLEAEPGFAELVAQGWPGWAGPLLPARVAEQLASGMAGRVMEGRVVLRLDPADSVVLLHIRRAVAADKLTAREREIAEAFSLGEPHRELGDRFGVSPNTVRRHLANIYEKLGISSKAELDRMLSGTR